MPYNIQPIYHLWSTQGPHLLAQFPETTSALTADASLADVRRNPSSDQCPGKAHKCKNYCLCTESFFFLAIQFLLRWPSPQRVFSPYYQLYPARHLAQGCDKILTTLWDHKSPCPVDII